MIKVAVVTSYFPLRDQPYRGHSAYQTLLRLRRWADIDVICPLTSYPRWFAPRNFPHVRIDKSFSPPGLRSQYLDYPALPGLTRAINGSVCATYLERRLEELKPDVILNYWIYPEGYAAVKVGAKLNIPVILGAIGSDLNRIPDAISRWNTRYALRRATFTITVSRHLREQAIRLGASPSHVRAILNGCDTSVFRVADMQRARFELGLSPQDKIILYVGRLDMAKGLQELLDAVVLLNDSRVKAVLVGEGPAMGSLQKHAEARGISEQVLFAGVFPTVGVAKWMAAADIFCLPSYAEGCPNVVVEALSCGRPVVATKVGGIPELIDDQCGILVPPRDPRMLSEALTDALARPWDQEQIARLYQRSWEQVAKETLEVCDAAVRSSGRDYVLAESTNS